MKNRKIVGYCLVTLVISIFIIPFMYFEGVLVTLTAVFIAMVMLGLLVTGLHLIFNPSPKPKDSNKEST